MIGDISERRDISYLLNGDLFLFTIIRLLDSQLILIKSVLKDNSIEEELRL